MEGRSMRSSKYRFGFNGKEKDSNGEFGAQTAYDYGFRVYNPSIGKFLSVDPLTKNYPMLTPYQFASNTPIQAIDLDGLEAISRIHSPWYLSEIDKAYNAGDVERMKYLSAKAFFDSRPPDKNGNTFIKDSYNGADYAGDLDFGDHQGLIIQNSKGEPLYHIFRIDKKDNKLSSEIFQIGGIPFTSEFANGKEPGPTIVAKYSDEETEIGSLLVFANFTRWGKIDIKGGLADIADRILNIIGELPSNTQDNKADAVKSSQERQKEYDTILSQPTYWGGYINLNTGKAPRKGTKYTIVDKETNDTTEVEEIETLNPRYRDN